MTAKILIVDDVPANLSALSDTLEPEGYHILVARSGEQALDAATRNRPDLILLDVMMPGLDGYETCRRLKANEATRSIPVIFLTVQDEIEKVVEGFRAGGVDYVTKPFQADELLIRIQTHLKVHFLSPSGWAPGARPFAEIGTISLGLAALFTCDALVAMPFTHPGFDSLAQKEQKSGVALERKLNERHPMKWSSPHGLRLTSCACFSVAALLLAGQGPHAAAAAPPADGKLRIIVFGAHPDDCEIQAGGVGALWAAQGHHVKFVSVSNGDIGHWRDAGGPLAQRRKAEVEAADKLLGVATEVLDVHDGEVLPTLENRRMLTRLIREWQADIVIGPRPNDYHPDHRYTSVLVQDAAYMVTVPFFCPDVPALKHNPVFLYSPDSFQKPNPFQADIAVSIDSVVQKKLDALAVIESQFYEGGANGSAELIPSDPEKQKERKLSIRESFARRNQSLARRFGSKLAEFYGADQAAKVQHAEAFELCEYGRQPDRGEWKKLFPFFEK